MRRDTDPITRTIWRVTKGTVGAPFSQTNCFRWRWQVSGVSTIGHQAAKQGGANRHGPLRWGQDLAQAGFGAGVCFIILVLKGVEVQIAQKISSHQPAVRDQFLIDRHWAWALQNAMSKSPTEFSPSCAALVRLRAAPPGFSRCVFSASPMLVQCHQEMVPDNLRGKYNEQ